MYLDQLSRPNIFLLEGRELYRFRIRTVKKKNTLNQQFAGDDYKISLIPPSF